MKTKEKSYLNSKVRLTIDIGDPKTNFFLKKGRVGVCTADLRREDVFAVWFEEPVSITENDYPMFWVTLQPWSEREKFEIIK